MKINEKEIKETLKDAVEIKALDLKNGKYKYSKKYKETIKLVAKDKTIKNLEDAMIKVLWRLGYFKKPRTVKETTLMCNLLTLK